MDAETDDTIPRRLALAFVAAAAGAILLSSLPITF
jgi:hypothetical protein